MNSFIITYGMLVAIKISEKVKSLCFLQEERMIPRLIVNQKPLRNGAELVCEQIKTR